MCLLWPDRFDCSSMRFLEILDAAIKPIVAKNPWMQIPMMTKPHSSSILQSNPLERSAEKNEAQPATDMTMRTRNARLLEKR